MNIYGFFPQTLQEKKIFCTTLHPQKLLLKYYTCTRAQIFNGSHLNKHCDPSVRLLAKRKEKLNGLRGRQPRDRATWHVHAGHVANDHATERNLKKKKKNCSCAVLSLSVYHVYPGGILKFYDFCFV